MLNAYDLSNKMRKTRRRYPLTATDQALYHELWGICNEEGWLDPFKCSNDELCVALQITEKTLINARNNLIQAGLVFYKSGKSRRQFGEYSFEKGFDRGLTTGNITVDTTVDTTANTTVDATVDATVNSSDYIKLKQKGKLNSNQTKEHLEGIRTLIIGLLRNVRSDLTDDVLMQEAGKILNKRPDIRPEYDIAFINSWASRIQVQQEKRKSRWVPSEKDKW